MWAKRSNSRACWRSRSHRRLETQRRLGRLHLLSYEWRWIASQALTPLMPEVQRRLPTHVEGIAVGEDSLQYPTDEPVRLLPGV